MIPHLTSALPGRGRSTFLGLAALAALTLLPFGSVRSRLDLTVEYTGEGDVDRRRPISVLLFDGPDMGASRMVGAAHATKSGKTLTFRDLPETVYLVAVYDPSGSFTGLSGMIPGSVIGIHAEDGGQVPSPVAVSKRTRLRFSFDDTLRLPGEVESVVPRPVLEAENGILEIRTYTAVEGKRDEFIDFFVNKTLAGQKKAGLRVVGQFRSLENPDQFVWIRAYASQEERARELRDFYLGPDWIAVQDEAATLIGDTHVMLVEPTDESDVR